MAQDPSEHEPGWAAPPAAPYPTGEGTAKRRRLTPRGGHRRRTASGVGAIAGIVLVGVRFLLGDVDAPSTDFSLPERIEGEPVRAVALTSEQVCGVLAPADLRQIYDRRFQSGIPTDTSPTPTSGEPSASNATLGEMGVCRWQTKTGEELLTVVAISMPAIGGDANRTYELLRPTSPIQGFDSTSDIGDEAFFSIDPIVTTPGYSDTMTMRDGGVVLRLTVTGPTKPEGGLDLLAEVGQAAATNLPPPG